MASLYRVGLKRLATGTRRPDLGREAEVEVDLDLDGICCPICNEARSRGSRSTSALPGRDAKQRMVSSAAQPAAHHAPAARPAAPHALPLLCPAAPHTLSLLCSAERLSATRTARATARCECECECVSLSVSAVAPLQVAGDTSIRDDTSGRSPRRPSYPLAPLAPVELKQH